MVKTNTIFSEEIIKKHSPNTKLTLGLVVYENEKATGMIVGELQDDKKFRIFDSACPRDIAEPLILELRKLAIEKYVYHIVVSTTEDMMDAYKDAKFRYVEPSFFQPITPFKDFECDL